MIETVFILENKKFQGIEREKVKIVKLLKRCGKVVQNSPENVDLIITMGGDGTFLRGIHLIKDSKTFIYGIKYGRVGFLANSAKGIEGRLIKILSGNFKPCRRMLLDVSIKRREETVRDFSLNEVVFFRRGIRIISLTLSSKKEQIFNGIKADGLIVSTPTGSTAHSLSACGPIVAPDMKCFIIIPVSPHTLSCRPVILPPEEKISVTVFPEAVLAIDGQREFNIQDDDIVTIKRSDKTVGIILDDDSFFGKLQAKFNWGI